MHCFPLFQDAPDHPGPPFTLLRRAKPADAYFAMALSEAKARPALGGYRLGESLNAILQ